MDAGFQRIAADFEQGIAELEGKPQHECGVFGAFGPPGIEVAQDIVIGINRLQHRGTDATGAGVIGAEISSLIKSQGKVTEVFPWILFPDGEPTGWLQNDLPKARAGVGHVRYGTTGESTDGQPYGDTIYAAHNGNFSNMGKIAEQIELPSNNDSENMTFLLEATMYTNGGDLLKATKTVFPYLEGGFGVVATDGKCLVGARDPNGLRPLILGQKEDGCFILASESVALDAVGAKAIKEIEPGQIVVADDEGVRFEYLDTPEDAAKKEGCAFEVLYFMDPDSFYKGERVRDIRKRIGRQLAIEEKESEHPIEVDYVVSIPSSANPAAEGYAEEMGKPFIEALEINPDYDKGRTFILETQEEREAAVQQKLRIKEEYRELLKGKRIAIIDDSIVRGTTMGVGAQLLWGAGAKEVHGRSASPPAKNDCDYGVFINHGDSPLLLVGNTPRMAAVRVKVDSLAYLGAEGLAAAIANADFVARTAEAEAYYISRKTGEKVGKLTCMACFDGIYPTEISIDIRGRETAQGMVPRIKKKHLAAVLALL